MRGRFYRNKNLLDAMRKTRDKSGRLHLLGLLGDGGVHSHQRHMEALIEMAHRERVGPFISIFFWMAGTRRQTAPSSLCSISTRSSRFIRRFGWPR